MYVHDLVNFIIVGSICLQSAWSESEEFHLRDESHNGNEAKQAEELFRDFWEWRLMNAPEFATFVGIRKYDERLDEMSLNAYIRRVDESKSFLKSLKTLQKRIQSPTVLSNLELLESQLSIFINGQRFPSYLWPMNILEGPQIDFPRLLSWMKKDTESDMVTILKRMRKFPQQVDELVRLMEEGIRLQITMHEISIKPLVNVLKKIALQAVTKSSLFKPFTTKPNGITPDVWKVLVSNAQKIIKELIQPAYMRLALFIENVYLSHTRPYVGLYTVPNGHAFYSACLKYHTTTNLTAQEIHNIGLSEVKRITERMMKVKDEVEFKGDLKKFRIYLKTDPKFNFSTGEEIVNSYKNQGKIIHGLLPKYFSVVPKTPYEIVPVPASVAATSPGAFYLAPSQDGSRPGTFYINTYKPHTRKRYDVVSLALHEAEPGHHLQSTLAIEQGSPLNFRRFMDDRKYYEPPASFPKYTAYVEGWGLYSEYLGEEMGLYTTPYDLFGRLSGEMLRACRLVVDTGIHALGWSREKAVDFMNEQTAMDMHDIKEEVDRYITWPGQACGYKIGELKIKQLRQKAKKALATKFDVKKFHTLIATIGGVPVDFLEKKVDKFIETFL